MLIGEQIACAKLAQLLSQPAIYISVPARQNESN
jgi:hypothetical protein